MIVQTLEISGQRFVIIPEPDFLELERRLLSKGLSSQVELSPSGRPKFEPVSPFDVNGESASEMLVRERR